MGRGRGLSFRQSQGLGGGGEGSCKLKLRKKGGKVVCVCGGEGEGILSQVGLQQVECGRQGQQVGGDDIVGGAGGWQHSCCGQQEAHQNG